MNHSTSLSNRPAPWAPRLEAALRAAARLLRRRYAAWQQQRAARRTHLALCELDEHLLRDIGLNRSEIGSLAAELGGLAEPTRVRAAQGLHGVRVQRDSPR